MPERHRLRQRAAALVETAAFQRTITITILANAAVLGVQATGVLTTERGLLDQLDEVALGIFIVELTLKIYAYGLRFFRNPWNCFDFVVVAVALLPSTGAFAVIRTLRLLRILRLISTVPSMRRVVSALLHAIPGMVSIIGLLVLLMYTAAVLATTLFGAVAPQYFGDLWTSLWSLFTVMTTENWPDYSDAVMATEPWAWIFFLGYIVASSFVVLNLFLAVIVEAMGETQEQLTSLQQQDYDEERSAEAAILAELAALRREVGELRRDLVK